MLSAVGFIIKKCGSEGEKMNCLFCNIIAKKIPAQIIFENEHYVAFNDIAPQAPIHILIIPKKHIATLNDVNSDESNLLGELMQIAKNLAQQLNIDQDGYRVVMNCNQNGGQAVYHIHLHLLGGRQMSWPPG